jgi:hypothetical protein
MTSPALGGLAAILLTISGGVQPARVPDRAAPRTAARRDAGLALGTVSKGGKHMTLTFPTRTVDTSTETALVCSDSAVSMRSAALRMMAHEHDTTPPKLVRVGDRCTRISEIDFPMNGRWEVRVAFADGDRAVFDGIRVN